MKKLLIFDKATKKIVGKHNFWEDHFDLEENWGTFDSVNQTALIVDKSIKEFNKKEILQPANYDEKISTPIFRNELEVMQEVERVATEKDANADKID